MGIRLNRYLASCGLGSRRACETLISEGLVTLNGEPVEALGTVVQDGDDVRVEGARVKPESPQVMALHKPKGFICSREDLENRKTIFDLLPAGLPRLFYVGRLDKDSEGLLILTNDGDLAQQLGHPRHKVPKVYRVGLDQPLDKKWIPKLKRGVYTPHGVGKFEEVKVINPWSIEVVLTQGLKRQIRYMFQAIGYKVVALKRIRIGAFSLGGLKAGEVKRLNERDLKRLRTDPRRADPGRSR
jgi:23S rRNA pseudouridine2605 synthase